jgi:hypothetical protein
VTRTSGEYFIELTVKIKAYQVVCNLTGCCWHKSTYSKPAKLEDVRCTPCYIQLIRIITSFSSLHLTYPSVDSNYYGERKGSSNIVPFP